MSTEARHIRMVADLVKSPNEILEQIDHTHIDLIHAAMGISGEAGRFDTIKKHAIYNQPLDVDNLKEELGDLEFYCQHMRLLINTTREEILDGNYAKLQKRYGNSYSDEAAKLRADKA